MNYISHKKAHKAQKVFLIFVLSLLCLFVANFW